VRTFRYRRSGVVGNAETYSQLYARPVTLSPHPAAAAAPRTHHDNRHPHRPKVSELARLTAASLATAGLKVAGPDPGDAEGCRLFIAGAITRALSTRDDTTAR
jgi:hypothetical protein